MIESKMSSPEKYIRTANLKIWDGGVMKLQFEFTGVETFFKNQVNKDVDNWESIFSIEQKG